jgi:hypothetical protein
MYNPYEEFEDNKQPLSQEVTNRLAADAAQAIDTVTTMMAAEKETQRAATSQPQPQSQSTTQPANQQPEEPAKDLGDYARDVAEVTMAAPTGVTDFGVDLVNKIPGVEIPKLPKFQNNLTQAVREISSLVIPTILLSKAGVKGGQALNAKVGASIGKSELVKWIGERGVNVASGVVVDATSQLNEQDDNLQGTLKKMFPKTFSWISNDWATLDSDSPDVKRAKNVNEGVGLGVFTDLLEGAAKLTKGVIGATRATRWIPENEQAKKFFEPVIKQADTSVEDTVLKSGELREVAKDDLGSYREAKGKPAPFFGKHDVYDIEEEGIRSVDPSGIVGAAVDQVRISKNFGTVYGRLSNMISESALKYVIGQADPDLYTKVEKEFAEQLKNAGKFKYVVDAGKVITTEDTVKYGNDLASLLLDPRMNTKAMKDVLDQYMSDIDGIRKIGTDTKGDVGYAGVLKSLKTLREDYVNLDTLRVKAYQATSVAGQISDLAEGARYMQDTAAIERAQEQILDKVEFLTVVQGRAKNIRGTGLNNIKLIHLALSGGNRKKAQQLADAAAEGLKQSDEEIIKNAKVSADTLRNISKERPEFLRPLQDAWERTDGNIDSMSKLNNFVNQSLPDIGKAFIDGQPEIPNVIVQGMWSNIYNSVLTSISTPLKAGFGNAALLLEKPISVLGGAVLGGDVKTLKRGWYQYSAFYDTMRKGLGHMSMVYKKAASDPNSVGYIMRDDIVRKNEDTMAILKQYAEAAQQRGEDGPMALYLQAESLHDLSQNPFLRFGANAMTALDGFARAVIANAEARGRAYDKFVDGGRKLDAAAMRAAADEHYNEMFDSTGMITDKAVDYASREIAMNLDNPAASALSSFIRQYPAIKPFLMFPTTSANMLAMMDKHSPWSIFAQDYNKIAYRPLSAFTADEITEILTTKGLSTDPDSLAQNFLTLRAEVRGRKAIGMLTISAAAGMFLNGHLRGNGHYDKERQGVRKDLGWKPRTYQGWDGNWYSYDGLGPISDFLALTADVMDNFDSVTETDLSTTLNKLGFILGANITNKSMLAGIEPMNDVLAGNPAAMNRWASSFASSLVPLSGARNEFGRLLAPQLREVDQDFFQLLRNRNKWTDVIDPKSALPNAHDWIDGKKVGYAENFFVRAFNAVSPMKVYDGVSPERQFLLDIEYDSRPSFMKNQKGVRYTPAERSELFSLIGQQGYFKAELQRIMQSNEAKAWRDSLKGARSGGADVDPKYWQNLYPQINAALDQAKRLAEVKLSNYDDVLRRQYQDGLSGELQKRGETLPILENK